MRKIVLMGIPYHGNIGDSAIAIAEKNLIEENFSNYKLYTMAEDNLDICCKRAKKYINNDDIILLHGGGNIGDTYVRPEKGRRQIIESFPENRIIILPQTCYFSNTEKGKKELDISKRIYNNHPNLTIMAREKKSYKFMKEHFSNAKVYLTPDIVMTLKESETCSRQGATLLFRTDVEKTLDDSDIEKIKQIVSNKFGTYHLSDMSLGHLDVHNIGGKRRTNIVKSKLKEFQKSKIVITDRLHGMIFAAITETPCVAFGSLDHKIVESYNWLKNLEYIQFCEDINKIEECINNVSMAKNTYYDNMFAKEIILKILNQEL